MSGDLPALSVVMAVYNADEAGLRASIESVLAQSFTDFEFILIDDGSTDGSRAVMEEYAARDRRVRVLSHPNVGLTRSLNIGIAAARGALIARQDADDVSYPKRFEMQVALFDDPAVVLAGGNCDDLYEDGRRGVWGAYEAAALQRVVFMKTPFAHSTAMMRTALCRDLRGYDESFLTAQDMELWMRMARRGRLAMVAEPVLARRAAGASSISRRRRRRQFCDALRARWRHNRGAGRVCALYHALRGYLIGLLPPSVPVRLKRMLGR